MTSIGIKHVVWGPITDLMESMVQVEMRQYGCLVKDTSKVEGDMRLGIVAEADLHKRTSMGQRQIGHHRSVIRDFPERNSVRDSRQQNLHFHYSPFSFQ